ncbi:MAG: hypothetical protein ACE5IG_00940 [Dehalococcoidia bacterium]
MGRRLWAMVLCLSALAACALGTPTPQTAELPFHPLLSGWAVPQGEEAGPFSETLKALVLPQGEELTSLLNTWRVYRSRGDILALGREPPEPQVVIVTYFLWRPLRGEPLTIDRILLQGTEVQVHLRLEEVPPAGREVPILAAPFQVVSLDRSQLPQQTPVRFTFLLDDQIAETLTFTPD